MFWTALAKALGVFVLLLGNTVFLIWAERKFVADMQNRLGPMRAGPFGVLQTVADGLKLFFKEQITPRQVERLVYFMAPMLSVVPATMRQDGSKPNSPAISLRTLPMTVPTRATRGNHSRGTSSSSSQCGQSRATMS